MTTLSYIALLQHLAINRNALNAEHLTSLLEAGGPINPIEFCNVCLSDIDKHVFSQGFNRVSTGVHWPAVRSAVQELITRLREAEIQRSIANKATKDLPIQFGQVDLRALIGLLEQRSQEFE
jgi:hypothetical protein